MPSINSLQLIKELFREKTLRFVLLTSTTIIVSLVSINIFYIYPSFKRVLIQKTESEAIRIGQHLSPEFQEHLIDKKNKNVLIKHSNKIQTIMNDFGIYKIKVFNRSGLTLLSSDEDDIGKINKNDYFNTIVAKGNVLTKVVRKDTKSLEGEIVHLDIIETYVPINENSVFLGAFEIYYDITSLITAMNKQFLLSTFLLLGLSGFLLFMVLIPLKRLSKITIQKEDAKNKLIESEKNLTGLINGVSGVILKFDNNGMVTFLNQFGLEYFGYQKKEILGHHLSKLLFSQNSNITSDGTNFIQQIFSNPKVHYNYENENLLKNGQKAWIAWTNSPLYKPSGEIEEILSVGIDITDQKQMQEKLQEESDNFKSVYYNAFSAISTIDGEQFIDCNKAFVAMLNATEKVEVMNTHPSILSPEMQPDGRTSFEKANEMISIAFDKGFNNFEWIHKKITGEEFPVDVSLTRINHEGKPVLHCLWKDLSKEKELIKNLNKAKEAAEIGSKTKAEFLANMSHEIRTPMNGVIGMIDMLLDTELTNEQHDFALSVGTSADSLLMLINDILDFSKIEAGKLDMENIEFDLRPTLESISDIMAIKSYEKDVEFACLIHDRVPCLLKGDPGRLRQILMNLAGNAIKFVNQGEISISVDLKEETSSSATLLFEVKDTGIGIPKDRLELLFESFTQADASTTRKYGGTGLGLTISKQLTKLMGGQIGVESTVGKGSCFWFTIVFDKQEKLKTKKEIVPESLKGVNILVVDDHAMNRLVFREFLKSWQCRFDEAVNGKQALSKLNAAANKKDPFHIAILDMQMPEMSGETLGRTIKDTPHLKQIHLVMATSIGQRGDSIRMEQIGFAAFITKPVKKAILFDCLRIVLGIADKDISKNAKGPIITKYTVEEKMVNENKTNTPYKILLAEDNLVNQKVAKKMLEKIGHNVTIANNGEEAVRIFKQSNFDLILMDGQMPIMDGIQAAKEIRDIEKNILADRIPIIAVTANAMKGDRERFLTAGMDGYVSKPLKKKKLYDAIEKIRIQK